MGEYFLVGLEKKVIYSGPGELRGTQKCGSYSRPGSAWDINLRHLMGIGGT